MDIEVLRKIKKIGLIIASIVLIISIPFAIKAGNDRERELKELAHALDNITIELVGCHSEQDDRNYYVYFDYKITNNTSEKLNDIEVVSYFTDKNGKSVGTVTTSLESDLNDDKYKCGQTTEESVYICESITSRKITNIFMELYNNGMTRLEVTNKAEYAHWADGYFVNRKN